MSDFYYAGIMTGTSLDAADAILCKDSGGDFTCIAHAQMAMPSKTARRLRHLNDNSALAEAMDVANVISHLCAQTFLEMASTPAGRNIKITALGCHGQTILHRPKSGWSVQLLNGALLAELTRVNVVCDFRARDIAAGGQGAPLAPLFHREIFIRHAPCAVVNLGGIANITTISENGDVKGWDIGPANMLMDAWYRQHHTENYDDNGKWAQSGTVVNDLLNQLLRHPFLLSPPPKSCGREQFDLRHFKESLASYPAPDAQATLLEWSAKIIAETIGRTNAKRAFLCGGGARNNALLKRIGELSSISIVTTDDIGWHAQHIEAAAFAWLAKQFITKTPLNLPPITGARGARILGALYPAPADY